MFGCSREIPVGVSTKTDGNTSASSILTQYGSKTLKVVNGYQNRYYIFSLEGTDSYQIRYKRAVTTQHATREFTWPEAWATMEPTESYSPGFALGAALHFSNQMFVFSIHPSNSRLIFRCETSPGTNSWTQWAEVASNQISHVISNSTSWGAAAAFGRDASTGKVRYFQRTVNNSWNNQLLGNRATDGEFEVVKKGDGRLMVILKGSSSQLYQLTQNWNGSWPSTYQAVSNSIYWYPGMDLKGIADNAGRVNLFLPDLSSFTLKWCKENGYGGWTNWSDVTSEWPSTFGVAKDVQPSVDRIVLAYSIGNEFKCRRQESNLTSWTDIVMKDNPNSSQELGYVQIEGFTWSGGDVGFISNISTAGMQCQVPIDGFWDAWVISGTYTSLNNPWRLCGGPYYCFEYDY